MRKKPVRRTKALLITGIIVAALAVAFGAFTYRHDIARNVEKASLPEAVEYTGEVPSTPPSTPLVRTKAPATPTPVAPVITQSALPAEVNLAVPFTAQAPHGSWEMPYDEFCEEASVLMVMRYISKHPITSSDDAAAAMLEIQKYEDSVGYDIDTTAAETATIITSHFKYPNVQLIENPTEVDIKTALAAGKPVIVPAAGRLLGNPYFQNPGPLYHMLVIKGYTKDGRFITNDPGTRRGADFIYSEETILNAIHDWRDDHNILQGKKVILVVG